MQFRRGGAESRERREETEEMSDYLKLLKEIRKLLIRRIDELLQNRLALGEGMVSHIVVSVFEDVKDFFDQKGGTAQIGRVNWGVEIEGLRALIWFALDFGLLHINLFLFVIKVPVKGEELHKVLGESDIVEALNAVLFDLLLLEVSQKPENHVEQEKRVHSSLLRVLHVSLHQEDLQHQIQVLNFRVLVVGLEHDVCALNRFWEVDTDIKLKSALQVPELHCSLLRIVGFANVGEFLGLLPQVLFESFAQNPLVLVFFQEQHIYV